MDNLLMLCLSLALTSVDPAPSAAPALMNSSTSTGEGNGSAYRHSHVSLNCTYSSDIVVPCQSRSCLLTTKEYLSRANASDPCLSGNHIVMEAVDYTEYTADYTEYTADYTLTGEQTAVAADAWLLFKHADGSCRNILSSSYSTSACMQPGFCNSTFPWYMRHSHTLPREYSEELVAELCTTDVTSRETAVCCRKPLPIVVRSCQSYSVYKILDVIPPNIAGRMCTARVPDFSIYNSTDLSSLSIKYTVNEEQTIPKLIDQLGEDEMDGLVTVNFTIFHLSQRSKVRELISVFDEALLGVLNEYIQTHRPRRAVQTILNTHNIRTIAGSPTFLSHGNTSYALYYTFYIQTDNKQIIPYSVVRRAIPKIPITVFMRLYSAIANVSPGIPGNIKYPIKERATTTPLPIPMVDPVGSVTSERKLNWMVIIYIVIFTCSVIFLTLIGLAIYRVELVKRRQRLRHRNRLSKLENCLLCQYNSEELGQETVNVDLLNTSESHAGSNTNGLPPTSHTSCLPARQAQTNIEPDGKLQISTTNFSDAKNERLDI